MGKTTVSKLLAKKLGAEYLSVDKILSDNNLDKDDDISVENFLKANEIITGISDGNRGPYVIDGNFYYQKQIDDLKNRFKDGVAIFTITSTVEKCIKRDAQREKVYGEDSVRYVYMVVSKVKAGIEIDNTDLTIEETIQTIIDNL
ncbi:MAG: hypothetical protein UY92_C0001G0055 [Candidatus Magasanikbacteria bacterium GW2011_GWA2_56_11]|uniref:Shikimate kinase n=1 Tax=Candidatus Magasanikbacteria bacterium GW2011_GWA2_56_11 TaxID=1619044 RepID=A0A0G1YIH8_9BACT|nr:MAG: hypothetical protein UY92_C0001G0055 [Candidatus Magasanikbacteria bacterium GW2011_GWA2_56_11]